MKQNNALGFTLIELMVVIAIIGILAAISIPYFNAYRVKSFNAAALSDLKNLSSTQELFYHDHTNYGPTDSLNKNKARNNGIGKPVNAGYLLGLQGGGKHPYISASKDVLLCSNVVRNTFSEYTLISKHTQSDRIYVMESDFDGMYYTKKNSKVVAGVPLTQALSRRVQATTKQDTRFKNIFKKL